MYPVCIHKLDMDVDNIQTYKPNPRSSTHVKAGGTPPPTHPPTHTYGVHVAARPPPCSPVPVAEVLCWEGACVPVSRIFSATMDTRREVDMEVVEGCGGWGRGSRE